MYHDQSLPCVAPGQNIDFEGLLFPVFDSTDLVELESHASLTEADWLADLLNDEHVLYFGVGIGLWAAHVALKARSVKVHDRNETYLKQAVSVAWANNRTAMVRMADEEQPTPTYEDRPISVVMNLRREPDIQIALAHRPKTIILFGACGTQTALTLIKEGYTYDADTTDAAVFRK